MLTGARVENDRKSGVWDGSNACEYRGDRSQSPRGVWEHASLKVLDYASTSEAFLRPLLGWFMVYYCIQVLLCSAVRVLSLPYFQNGGRTGSTPLPPSPIFRLYSVTQWHMLVLVACLTSCSPCSIYFVY